MVQEVITWIQHHSQWAYLLVGLIACIESLVIIGALVPGSIVLASIGALVGADVLAVWPVVIAAIIGAMVGDWASFGCGYFGKDRVQTLKIFLRYEHWFIRGKAFFAQHGLKSVIIGRFIGPLRGTMPMIAGLLHMRPRRFLIGSVVSAVLWAPAYLFPGVLIGAVLKVLPGRDLVDAALFLTVFVVSLIVLHFKKNCCALLHRFSMRLMLSFLLSALVLFVYIYLF